MIPLSDKGFLKKNVFTLFYFGFCSCCCYCCLIGCVYFLVLAVKPRIQHMPDKWPTSELHSQIYCLFYL